MWLWGEAAVLYLFKRQWLRDCVRHVIVIHSFFHSSADDRGSGSDYVVQSMIFPEV